RVGQQCAKVTALERERALGPLQGDVLVGGGVRKTGDQTETGFADARADAVDKGQLPDRRVNGPFINGLLHLVQDRLSLLTVELDGLLLVQLVEIGVVAVDKDAALDDMGFEAGRGVAERAGSSLD